MRPLRALLLLAGAAAAGLSAAMAAFVIGIRRKDPATLRIARVIQRDFVNPLALRRAGEAGSQWAVVRHVGRRSGRPYETPVGATAEPGGFVVMLPYGAGAQWVRNVRAAGSAVLAVDDGRAVIAAGSADGVPPSVLGPSGTGAWVLLGGIRREIVEIGIDTLEVDLGEGTARPGDVATLFGAGDDGEPTAEEWAGWAGTVEDEIVARASTRGERVLRG